MALHEAWAPVFASFQAASRDHQPEARRSSGIADRTGRGAPARLRAGRRRPAAPRWSTTSCRVLIRCSFYAEQAPADTSAQPLVEGVAQLFHRITRGPDRGRERRPLAGAAAGADAAVAAPEPAADARPLRAPRREDPAAAARRRCARCCPPGATTTPGSTTSSPRPASATAPSTATSRTRTTSSGCWPRRRRSRMIDLIDELHLDAPPDDLRAWLRRLARRLPGRRRRHQHLAGDADQRGAGRLLPAGGRLGVHPAGADAAAARLRRPGGRRHHAPRPHRAGAVQRLHPAVHGRGPTPSRTCSSPSGAASSPCPTDGLGPRCSCTSTVPAVGDVPERMLAAVVKGPGRLEVEDVPGASGRRRRRARGRGPVRRLRQRPPHGAGGLGRARAAGRATSGSAGSRPSAAP